MHSCMNCYRRLTEENQSKKTHLCKECLEKLKAMGMPDDDGKEVESIGRQVESS